MDMSGPELQSKDCAPHDFIEFHGKRMNEVPVSDIVEHENLTKPILDVDYSKTVDYSNTRVTKIIPRADVAISNSSLKDKDENLSGQTSAMGGTVTKVLSQVPTKVPSSTSVNTPSLDQNISDQPLDVTTDIAAEPQATAIPEVENLSQDEYFPVQKIIRGKFEKGTPYYLVKWKNFSPRWNSWVPYDHLSPQTQEEISKSKVRMYGRPPDIDMPNDMSIQEGADTKADSQDGEGQDENF